VMSAAESTEQPTAHGGKTRRKVIGRVVSDKMNKSVTVAVERLVRHSIYGKYIRRTKKIMAHDEENSARIGDTVAISECSRISRRKSWRAVEIVARAEGVEQPQADEAAGQGT